MAIPDFQSNHTGLMLTILADDQDHTVKEIRERLAGYTPKLWMRLRRKAAYLPG